MTRISEYTTSTGHDLSAASWLDAHFQICESGYARLVEMAGFKSGWRLLDAGSGSGSFLNLLVEQVGPTGALTAVDIAPENVNLVRERLEREALATQVQVVRASIFDLPFPDNTFDGVWCANVTMCLTDDELRNAITEFSRVVRPGGLIALKDFSSDVSILRPIPVGYYEHLIERHIEKGDVPTWRGAARTWNLRSFLAAAGLVNVSQRTLIIDHRAPLSPLNQRLQGEILVQIAQSALEFDLPESEQDFWQHQLDPSSRDATVNSDDYFFAECQMLAVGCVP